MNIIFLDFDGVLVPYDSKDGTDYFGAKFHHKCIDNLSEIIRATKAQIVITSSWSNHFSLFLMKFMWKYRKMPGSIIGSIKNDSFDRGTKIDIWLSKHAEMNYIIIDDMETRQFRKHQQSRIIQPDTRFGLNKNDVLLAIQLLQPSEK